jgi:glucosamine--fructose-6-phosphate aminotransferase (isomerizing)
MCGIFGILTKNKIKKLRQLIIDGLIQLQNRGYDSSGVCVLNDNNFEIHKYASTNEISSLNKLISLELDIDNKELSIGIGHNRWATHGAKNDINAHPHISNDKKFVLVHNGIIENYQDLKAMLVNDGYTFYSQTDTEVIVNLISYNYNNIKNNKVKNNINNNLNKNIKNENKTLENQINDDIEKSISETINQLEGTYGIILMFINNPDKIYCVRNGSPLLIGSNDDSVIITSEQSGFCNMVNTYITLNNDDICVISIDNKNNKLQIDTSHKYIQKNITLTNYDLTPYPYQYWTIKEIYEQEKTVINSFNRGGRIKNVSEVKLGGLEENINILKSIKNLILLGCGTSYHAGLYGLNYLKTLCNFNTVNIYDGADFNIMDVPKEGKTALILISQSGETRDLHRCIEIAKDNNIFTIGVINVVDSLIAREVDCGVYCNAGREMGVASTKAFTSQVICLSLIAVWFSQMAGINEIKRKNILKDLKNLSNDIKNTLSDVKDDIIEISTQLKNYDNLFLLGKGTDEAVAKEGSLKIKEISYIHSEGYSASALKHGPFALLDERFPVILLNCIEEYNSKIYNCFEEVHSRNSPVYIITNNNNINLKRDCKIIKVRYNKSYSSLLGILPLQLMAYYISINKNINPDIPKNLAKVVTVE